MPANSPRRKSQGRPCPDQAYPGRRPDHHHGCHSGRASPKLISKAQVAGMKAGAVIVDLSAEGGGNCEDTRPARPRKSAR
jgi:hypothetical protein